MSKKQYEEFEDRLVFREGSSRAIVIVLFLVFILFPLVMISTLINVNLVFTVLILGSGFVLWLVWWNFTRCELILKRNEKVLIHECIHSLSKKKKTKMIPFSKITTIQIDISDELYGGTSEREIYEVISIKFIMKGGEEFDKLSLKANHEFRKHFSSAEKLVNKLQTFTNLPHNAFRYSSHSFIGGKK